MDRYIIGQDDAKVALSVAVYNHYKRIYFQNDSDVELKEQRCSSAPGSQGAVRRSAGGSERGFATYGRDHT